MHTSNTDHDETLKEQIETILDTCIFTALDAEMHSTATSVATNRILDMLGEDRERAVRENTPVTIMGKTIEEVWVILSALELEHIEDMKMTMSNLDRWMKRVREDQNKAMLRAIDNSYSQLSNPSQTKKTK